VGIATKVAEAFDKVIDFIESFEALDDPRHRGKVLYLLDEVLLLVLFGVLAGCECWVEIARFGDKKLDLLRRFRYSTTAPRHMINSAKFSWPSLPSSSRAASSPGSRGSAGWRPASSPSTARRSGAPIRRAEPRRRST